MESPLDILVIGAGPAGIAVGRAAVRRRLRVLLLERGAICNTIFRFPERMTFFSTTDLVEFADAPLVSAGDKPTRHEALTYFTRLTLLERLPVASYEAALAVERQDGVFRVRTARRELTARAVVLATGTFDQPNLLGVPGEELPHVSHYYHSPQPYVGRRVLVIGGRNSAAETALELYRHGAHVTLAHRGDSLAEASIKYWLLPDLQNRVRAGAIRLLPRTTVRRIEDGRVLLATVGDGENWLDADFVLALTGYHPDYDFVTRAGVALTGAKSAPLHDPATLETNVPGLYVAGVLTAGSDPGKVFIENSRHHGETIIHDYIQKRGCTDE